MENISISIEEYAKMQATIQKLLESDDFSYAKPDAVSDEAAPEFAEFTV